MADTVAIPITVAPVLGAFAAAIPASSELRVVEVDGWLRLMTSGTHTIEVRNGVTGAVIATLSWTVASPNLVRVEGLDITVPDGMGLSYAVTSLGVGAVDCTITVWATIQ